jgi:hypothetical protein
VDSDKKKGRIFRPYTRVSRQPRMNLGATHVSNSLAQLLTSFKTLLDAVSSAIDTSKVLLYPGNSFSVKEVDKLENITMIDDDGVKSKVGEESENGVADDKGVPVDFVVAPANPEVQARLDAEEDYMKLEEIISYASLERLLDVVDTAKSTGVSPRIRVNSMLMEFFDDKGDSKNQIGVAIITVRITNKICVWFSKVFDNRVYGKTMQQWQQGPVEVLEEDRQLLGWYVGSLMGVAESYTGITPVKDVMYPIPTSVLEQGGGQTNIINPLHRKWVPRVCGWT